MNFVKFAPLGLLAALAAAGAAHASTISYTFDTGAQGWTYGDVSSATPNDLGSAPWAGGELSLPDLAGQTGVFAPAAVLGNQSAAYGGSISWAVADAYNDAVPYAALILYGATKDASIDLGPPSTDVTSLTTYTVSLTESSFKLFTGGYNSSATAISAADFKAILGDLQGIGFDTEYKTGADDSRFDNAVFTGFGGIAAAGVPEPSTWAMLLTGLFGLGAVLRLRRRGRAVAAVA